ncbi:hypothetical protein TSAR_011617 [Trichomalopsis sarcophagae]|uniref:Chitin-binding type-2 domain-containing protein n=1 Tax=Trichomalopsis sarcophagae TaxID=543379 RepID=A0A232FBI5_9HYME|nr:hypothetical protein TSAR_011617 [Trichomalopsis sarcophagae]
MKVITIVAILGLITSGSAYYEPECENNSGQPILLPNLEDCTSYFTCRNGFLIMTPCPNGQHFNPRKLKCTDPEEAKCIVTTTTQKPTTTTSATTPTPTPTTTTATTTTTTTTITTTITPKPTPSDPVKCPAPNGSGDIVLLPNPKDCRTYFRCREGLPITTSCPEGLHFDPRNLICTYPDEAGCEVTTTTVITSTTTAKPVTCPPDNKPIKLPNPYDCSTYYSCIEGVPNLMACPNGLHFNPVELECDFPEDAGCEVFSTSTPEPTTTTPKPTTTTPEPTTTTPKPTTTTPEPTTTTPKPTTTTPEPTTTTSEPTTTTPKPTTTTPEPTTTTPKPTTTTPEPTTTTPEPTTTTSEPTTTISETTTTTPEPTTTTPKATTTTPEPTTTTLPVTCSVQGELIPNPKDCGSYYQCSNGRPWLMRCPPDLHYWPEKKRCDYPHNAKKLITIRFVYKSACDGPLTYQSSFGKNVDCIAANFNMKAILFVALFGVIATAYAAPKVPVPVTFAVTTAEPIPSSVKCPLRPSVGKEDLLPHPDRPDRCGDYYHCVSGTPKLMHCPNGLHFNPKKNWCDWPWEADFCKDAVTITLAINMKAFFVVALFGVIAVAYAGPLTFETITKGAPVPPSVQCPIPSVGRDDLLPNPNDCGSYYHCVNGVPKLKKCPSDLHFNPANNWCDWPWAAQCDPFVFVPATVVLVLTMVAAFAAPNHPKKRSSAQKSGVKCPTPSIVGKDDLFPNPHDCATYYQCAHGTPTLMPCPAGLHFNPREQYCDWPWEAGCDPYFDPKPSSTPKTRTCKDTSL